MTPDERSVLCELRDKAKQLEGRLDRAVEQIRNLHDQVGIRDVGGGVIRNEERITELEETVKANKANFQAKGGILLRHREMTEEGLRDLNSRIERIERKLDESCHPFPESVSMDNKYRCPLCKTQQWVLATGFAMNCSCGAKLQLSHHGKIMCSFHKSYDAEVYKI